jgi:hypothetical protein
VGAGIRSAADLTNLPGIYSQANREAGWQGDSERRADEDGARLTGAVALRARWHWKRDRTAGA